MMSIVVDQHMIYDFDKCGESQHFPRYDNLV